MSKPTIHRLTTWEKENAFKVAKERRDYHRSYGTTRHWDDEEKGEYADEYWGMIGEMVFRKHITHRILDEPIFFPPLWKVPQGERIKYDARIGDKTIEIKTIPPDSHGKRRIRMMIKAGEFHNDDYYVAIKFWDEDTYSFCGYLTLKEVLDSGIVNNARGTGGPYSEGYSIFLSDLHKMTIDFYKK